MVVVDLHKEVLVQVEDLEGERGFGIAQELFLDTQLTEQVHNLIAKRHDRAFTIESILVLRELIFSSNNQSSGLVSFS